MAIPRVFISSTCYDLKHIRESLKFFVKSIGYEPVLSEEGDVFYNPRLHTHDSCVAEIENCQLFVLIIGGRYGGEFRDSERSITNKEYESAIKLKIPIFALVDDDVYKEHHLFGINRLNTSIEYPSVDNIKIFDFIDQVRKNAVNNAIVPFSDFSDIDTYLKKQWAGMMYYYLTSETEWKTKNLPQRTIISSEYEEYKQVVHEKKKNEKKALSQVKVEYLNLWTELKNHFEGILNVKIGNPPTTYYYNIPFGIGGMHFEWVFQGRPRNKFGVEIHFEKSKKEINRHNLRILKPYINDFEKLINHEVTIEEDWTSKWSRIRFKLDQGNIDHNLKEFAKNSMVEMYKYFVPVFNKERSNFK